MLSILAMMAAAINAQCALACFLQADLPAKDPHACCKSHKTPLDQKRQSCPKEYATVDSLYKAQALDQLIVPVSAGIAIQLAVDARLRFRLTETHRAPDIRPLTNLRI